MDHEVVDDDPTPRSNRTRRRLPAISRIPRPNFARTEPLSNDPDYDDPFTTTERRGSGSRSPQKRKRTADDTSNRSSRSSSSVGRSQSESDAASSTAFSDSIKTKTKRSTNNCCWLCGNHKSTLDVAHVIPKASKEFQNDYEHGRLPFASVASLENSIPLCKLCHDAFDQDPPFFSVVPLDLQYFIDFEESDFKRRQALIDRPDASTIPKSEMRRIVPTGEMYEEHMKTKESGSQGQDKEDDRHSTASNEEEAALPKHPGGPYEVYLRVNFFPYIDMPTGKFPYARQINWHGSPTAMIMHAMRNLARGDGWMTMSRPVKRQLDELQYLWYRELEPKTPSLFNLPPLTNPSSASRPTTDMSASDGDSNNGKEGRPKPLVKATPLPMPPVNLNAAKESLHRQVAPWQWGPTACANDVVKFYTEVKELSRTRRPQLDTSND